MTSRGRDRVQDVSSMGGDGAGAVAVAGAGRAGAFFFPDERETRPEDCSLLQHRTYETERLAHS